MLDRHPTAPPTLLIPRVPLLHQSDTTPKTPTHLNLQFVSKNCIAQGLVVWRQGIGPHPHLQAYRCPARTLCLYSGSSLVLCVLHHTTLREGIGGMVLILETLHKLVQSLGRIVQKGHPA